MGEEVASSIGAAGVRTFTKALLTDLQALERMLEDGAIESGVRRFGCEQEMFLVDRAWRPAPVAMEVLELLDESAFTTELARFNLEMNIEPMLLEGGCFSALQVRIQELLEKCQSVTPRRRVKFKDPLYLLDSMVINLCLSIFPWTTFRKRKGAIKLHYA